MATNPTIDARLVEACARAAHEANRAYCLATGDDSQQPWDAAAEWQRESARRGVSVALAGVTAEEQHAAWARDKVADGWTYGPTKDVATKTHPCLVPYDRLPAAQRRKDDLYQRVVRAMADALGGSGG